MRLNIYAITALTSLLTMPAFAQTSVPKSAPHIPPPVISPTLPMTAPAPAPTLVPAPAPQVVAPPPAVSAPVAKPASPAAPKLAPAPAAAAAPPAKAPPVAAAKAPAVSAAAPVVAKAKPAAATGKSCTRLPLSDIQFGRENTIKVAREKLEEYAQKVAKEKGWKNGYVRSNETATCEDYLWLPIGGQEYKCLVAATFCAK